MTNYRRAPFFEQYIDVFEQIYATDWEYAALIEYYARRPVIIDARGPLSTDWEWVAAFYLSEDEQKSYQLGNSLFMKIAAARFYSSTARLAHRTILRIKIFNLHL